MKTINIKGKEYIPVNERLKFFRENYPNYCLVTELIQATEQHCVFKASIVNPDGVLMATAHAHETQADGYINKTSFIENCETSAWGRVLGNFGIGIDTSVASADEVNNAISKPAPTKKNKTTKSKLTAPQLEAMLDAIKDGKGDLVRGKLSNYTLTKPQENLIAEALDKIA
jgi:hypothetical protein